MFEFFRTIVGIAVPVFVITTMLNVGLTQKLSEIIGYLRDWPFVLRMLAANFIVVPLVMLLILRITSLAPAQQAGLLVFSLGAGAPFLIKLTEIAKHHSAAMGRDGVEHRPVRGPGSHIRRLFPVVV